MHYQMSLYMDDDIWVRFSITDNHQISVQLDLG